MSRVLRFRFPPTFHKAPAGLVPPGGTERQEFIHLPALPLRVYSPDGRGRFLRVPDALLDTGSLLSVLRKRFLGKFDAGPKIRSINHRWGTIDYVCDIHSVTLELCEDSRTTGKTWLWPAAVGFTEAPLPYDCLLGRIGFFEVFNVKFQAQPPSVEIEAGDPFDQIGGRME